MIPQEVVEIRESLCVTCAPLAFDPCASCEHGMWGRYNNEGCNDTLPPQETPEQRYARAFPEQHRGISGCCDRADQN